MSPPMFVVFGGGCVLILSVFGEGHWSGPSISSSLGVKSSRPASTYGLAISAVEKFAEVGALSEPKVRLPSFCLRHCLNLDCE